MWLGQNFLPIQGPVACVESVREVSSRRCTEPISRDRQYACLAESPLGAKPAEAALTLYIRVVVVNTSSVGRFAVKTVQVGPPLQECLELRLSNMR